MTSAYTHTDSEASIELVGARVILSSEQSSECRSSVGVRGAAAASGGLIRCS
jgi:hypothetical protein